MLKKTIEFNDWNDVPHKEDFYFNLTRTEILNMQLETNGGLDALLERMIQTQDQAQLIVFFQDLIKRSYGVKSVDGRKFVKNDEVFEDFKSTPAYDVLYMELATDSKKAAAFINGLMPREIMSQISADDLKTELEAKNIPQESIEAIQQVVNESKA